MYTRVVVVVVFKKSPTKRLKRCGKDSKMHLPTAPLGIQGYIINQFLNKTCLLEGGRIPLLQHSICWRRQGKHVDFGCNKE